MSSVLRPRNAGKTKNPKLWENYYWGNGSMASEEICKNRDTFYDAWDCCADGKLYPCQSTYQLETNHHNIFEKYVSMPNEVSDHSEYYRLKNSRVRIICFHPYYISDENTDLVKANGFREIIPMYANGARSFMKIVDNISKNGRIITEHNDYDFTPLLL